MISRVLAFVGLAVLAVLASPGCSGSGSPETPAPSPAEQRAGGGQGNPGQAKVLTIPGAGESTAPPPSPESPHGRLLLWDLPEGWVQKPPTSRMRYAEYAASGPGGPGECIVYYFGAGQGGDPMSNAVRWAGQFTQPDGSPSADRMQVTELSGAAVPVQIVEVTGTYDGGLTMTDAPAEQKEGYMLLGGIAQGPDAPWFFKFTGPESTVRAQKDAFVGMLRSIKLGG
jgi:hypothetical protein